MPTTATNTATNKPGALVPSSGSGISLANHLPPWLVKSLSNLSKWLVWPFIGGIMYGVGEITAKELLARKAKWGVAPSAQAAVAKAHVDAQRRFEAEQEQRGSAVVAFGSSSLRR